MDKLLNETLRTTGIRRPENLKIEIREYSTNNEEENKKIYKEFNKLLFSLIESKKPDVAIHITGEMRALSDKNHRFNCRKLWDTHHERFDITFNLPKETKISVRNIYKYTKEHWHSSSWWNHLDAFDLIADGKVNLYASPDREKVHYTILDNRYILLQSRHPRVEHTKYVWILESKQLCEILISKAKDVVKKSMYLNPSLFKEFTSSISSNVAVQTLLLVYHGEKVHINKLYNELKTIELFENLT